MTETDDAQMDLADLTALWSTLDRTQRTRKRSTASAEATPTLLKQRRFDEAKPPEAA